jgi:hypothetical protein
MKSLSIIPPIEEDELISSWVERVARFYGQSVQNLFADPNSTKSIELSEIDLGLPKSALKPIAARLGISTARIATYTLAADYPWSMGLVAQGVFVRDGHHRPRLRYAACPNCLEEQRLARGISWLRRAWILAPRTLCPAHQVRLVERQTDDVAHPSWSHFLRRHQRYIQVGGNVASTADALELPATSHGQDTFFSKMVAVQEGILGAAARRKASGPDVVTERSAIVAADLIWAFTRADRHNPDRLVYEAFASEIFDGPRQMAQRRQSGPVDFNSMHIDERHILLATATVNAGPQSWRHQFYPAHGPYHIDVGNLHDCLMDPDREELSGRQRQWPTLS